MKCKSIFFLAIMSLLAFGCNEIDDGSYAEPITLYEKVNGDWSLMNLKMVDEFAKTNKIKPDEQNLSTLFNYADFKINFSVNEKMNPTSYEVTGNVPPLFPPKGFWKLSSAFQPTDSSPLKIYLYNDEAKTKSIGEFRVTSVPNSNGEMEIQLVRISGGAAFISYVFKLNTIK
ncbi:DUF5004 domain-containing protein [Flavobacterium franklandianum]|uniref:DUF5004 domain-containing protein n=1 Tax=Flavobacterium franklandianum TaxID=2594430 RepID=A0A553CM63_9FLAO|nr:DUF5004 domain-containing protein [Flavobacterium franklandianum]TRX21658.1 DUF5004 domain-containing protein [Flavobacterium franklandianum]